MKSQVRVGVRSTIKDQKLLHYGQALLDFDLSPAATCHVSCRARLRRWELALDKVPGQTS
jgi:hypothetical protein